jgi:hypothetical protein
MRVLNSARLFGLAGLAALAASGFRTGCRQVLVLSRKRPGWQTVKERVDGWSGAFSIQRLEGSLFGNWPLWILDRVCAGGRAVRRGHGPENRLIADAALKPVAYQDGGGIRRD